MSGRPFPETHFVVKCHTCGKYYGIARDRKQGGLEAFLARGPRCINTGGNVDTSGRRAYYGVVPPGQVCGALLGRGMWGRYQADIRIATREELLTLTVIDRQSYVDLQRELAQARKDLDTVQRELTAQVTMQPAPEPQPVEAEPPKASLTHRQTIEHLKSMVVGEFPDVELVDIEQSESGDDAYLSVPTGHSEAVELELQNGSYFVTGRSWDRTGGLSSEHEFGTSTNPYGAINLFKRTLRQIRADQARLEAQFNEAYGEGE